jgi:hypothetical protein
VATSVCYIHEKPRLRASGKIKFNRSICIAAIFLVVDSQFSFPFRRLRWTGAFSLAFLPAFAFCLANIQPDTPSRELLKRVNDSSQRRKRDGTYFRQISGRMQSRELFCRVNTEWAAVAFGLYRKFASVVSLREDIKDTVAEDECTLYLYGKVLR